MTNRKDLAVTYKHSGNNCCQAVLLAFADKLNLPEDQLSKIGAAFGVGMGCMEATCGALCAVEIMLGLQQYHGVPVLAKAKEIHQHFNQLCGATICKDLKGRETGIPLCSCDDCVRNAVETAESYLF